MENRAVITLPLSPVKYSEYARLVVPIVGETISKGINANFHLAVNLLDSYKDRTKQFASYHQMIYDNNIEGDIWVDAYHLDQLLANITQMIKLGYIKEQEIEVLRCACGIIEIEKKNLATCNPQKSHFEKLGDQIYCTQCGSICPTYKEKHLIFDSQMIPKYKLNFMPEYLNKDIKTFEKTIGSSYIVISRSRDTGIPFYINGKQYFIDVDFLWASYLALFSEKDKIVLCGNKELYQLFLVGIIEKSLNSEANSIFIGTPIINDINSYNIEPINEDEILTKKLAVILNLKWNTKERTFDEQVLKYIRNMPYAKKKHLYAIICREETRFDSFDKTVTESLYNQFNSQRLIKTLKEEKSYYV